MSMQDQYELRVDMADWEGNTSYAIYDLFEVGDVVSNYLLAVDKYKGNAGNRIPTPLKEQRTQPIKLWCII
jgi:hypothetical protein